MAKITYYNIPDYILPKIQFYVEQIKDFFPTWCHNIRITYNVGASADGTQLMCVSDYHYRQAELTFCEAFFSDNAGMQELLHEVQHMILAPYVEKVTAILQSFITDHQSLNYIVDDLNRLEESLSQDSARMLKLVLDKANISEYNNIQ